MTVEILRLTGVSDGDHAVGSLLKDVRGHPDLSRLLVIDDTAGLLPHLSAYERLLTSKRLDHLLCVAVGPRARDGGKFRFPANISGAQGSAVIWVSDQDGIDWRLSPAAIAVGHTGNSQSGLHNLVDLLSVDEVFDRVCELAGNVPGGVASPGLRLTGTEDEGVRFTAALMLAIQRLTSADPVPAAHADAPFAVLLAASPGTAGLAEGGEISRYREDVIASQASASEALARYASPGGLLGGEQPEVYGQVQRTGAALGAFRRRVARLLTDANAQDELTEAQRAQLTSAGIKLPAQIGGAGGAGNAGEGAAGGGPPTGYAARSATSRVIAEAIQGGDSLPQVARRLNLTASALARPGSASYLPSLDAACPPALVDGLTAAPEPPRPWRWVPAAAAVPVVLGVLVGLWKSAAGIAVGLVVLLAVAAAVGWSWHARVTAWRRQLRLDEAAPAADEVARLVNTVAAREWCGAQATPAQLTRARIALQAVNDELAKQASATAIAPGARVARLSEALLDGLCQLVLAAVTAGTDPAHVGGEAISAAARDKAAQLLTQWQQDVRTGRTLERPAFAAADQDKAMHAGEDELAAITAAVLYNPREVMWQLCAPADLSALDMTVTPQSVALAPRTARPRLAEVLPKDTVWSSSGEQAGLLRLVPLHVQVVEPVWTANEQLQEPLP